MPRFLLGILHPRRLPFFLNSIEKIDFIDKVFAENMPSRLAYESLRSFALDKGYDYLILSSDDVVVEESALRKVIEAVLTYNYPVTTGWCWVRPNLKLANITLMPPKNLEKRLNQPLFMHEYGFVPKEVIDGFVEVGVKVVQVWFVGMSLTAIRQDVLRDWEVRGWFFQQHFTFKPETYRGQKGFWSCFDLWFSYDSWRKGYKKICVLDAYVEHSPVGYSHDWRDLTVGKLEPNVRFEEAKRSLSLLL